jgi:hypothetical protein
VIVSAYALAAIVLTLKVAAGNLWSKLTLINAGILGILGALAKFNPKLLTTLASSIAMMQFPFQLGLIAILAVLIYISCVLVHNQAD